MDRPSDASRHHSVSLPGIRTLFPGIISGQRIFFQPNHSSNPTRSSLGYQRKKLPPSITHHPHSLFSCPSFLLRCSFRRSQLMLLHFRRNNPFARYPVVTTLAQPASRGPIQGPSTGGYPHSLFPLMAIAPSSRPHLLVTPSRPQSPPPHHALPTSRADPLSNPNRKRPAFIPSVPRGCCLARHRLRRQSRKTRVPVPTLHRRATSAPTTVSLRSPPKSNRTPEGDTRARTARNVSTAPAASPSM